MRARLISYIRSIERRHLIVLDFSFFETLNTQTQRSNFQQHHRV